MLWMCGLIAVVALVVLALVISAGERTGAQPSGARLEHLQTSPQWQGRRFKNHLPRTDGRVIDMVREYFFGGQGFRTPEVDAEAFVIEPEHLNLPPKDVGRVTWFGHSSLLVELDERRILIDPVWSQRASPFTWAGPKRFYQPPVSLESLPKIDAVIISHDHYDHLDMEAVKRLLPRSPQWICPLGVGSHLEKWGVSAQDITELDWWSHATVGTIKVTATPSRHFSGRSVVFTDQNKTLWAGWSIAGDQGRIFYSGDTALHPDFETIGQELGPFDLSIMEIGAYDALWPDVHLGPEQALIAHQLVRGRVMMPVHWGTFDLALHGWVEPIERLLEAAQLDGVRVVVPRPGGVVRLNQPDSTVQRWWSDRPWRTAGEAPVWSSSVEHIQAPLKAKLSQKPEP